MSKCCNALGGCPECNPLDFTCAENETPKNTPENTHEMPKEIWLNILIDGSREFDTHLGAPHDRIKRQEKYTRTKDVRRAVIAEKAFDELLKDDERCLFNALRDEIEVLKDEVNPHAIEMRTKGVEVLVKQLETLISYATWQIDEGYYHPTLPSAVAATKEALKDWKSK